MKKIEGEARFVKMTREDKTHYHAGQRITAVIERGDVVVDFTIGAGEGTAQLVNVDLTGFDFEKPLKLTIEQI